MRVPIRDYVDTPEGRALAVVEALERRLSGSGYTYADLIDYLTSPLSSVEELRWRKLTVSIPRWQDSTDRERVLSTLRTRAELWGQRIERADTNPVDTVSLARTLHPEPDPFAGLPAE